MKPGKIKLSIENPCHQDWNEMSNDLQGKFCNRCSTPVIDFTGMSDKEIIQLLSTNSGKICGRTKSTQLNRTLEVEKSQSFTSPYKFLAGLFIVSSGNSFATTQFQPKLEIAQSKMIDSNILETKLPDKDSLVTVIEGIVRDENMEPLVGVVIKIRDSKIGVISDIDGKFKIVLPDDFDLNVISIYSEYYDGTANEVIVDRSKAPFLVEMIVTTNDENYIIGEIVPRKKWWQFWK